MTIYENRFPGIKLEKFGHYIEKSSQEAETLKIKTWIHELFKMVVTMGK